MSSKRPLVLMMTAMFFLLSCFDEVNLNPPCFLNGMSQDFTSSVVEFNACCETGVEGDNFCVDLFSQQGYTPSAPLASCTESSTCALCEVGVNCECVNNRSCERGEQCVLVDDPNVCKEAGLDLPTVELRCTVCVPLSTE